MKKTYTIVAVDDQSLILRVLGKTIGGEEFKKQCGVFFSGVSFAFVPVQRKLAMSASQLCAEIKKALKENKNPILLMDKRLENGLDGRTVLHMLGEDTDCPCVPCIAFTTDPVDLDTWPDDVLGFFPKPLTLTNEPDPKWKQLLQHAIDKINMKKFCKALTRCGMIAHPMPRRRNSSDTQSPENSPPLIRRMPSFIKAN